MMADEVGRPEAYRDIADAIRAGDPARRRAGRPRPTRTRNRGAA